MAEASLGVGWCGQLCGKRGRCPSFMDSTSKAQVGMRIAAGRESVGRLVWQEQGQEQRLNPNHGMAKFRKCKQE